jgi:WD repeat-containing protein 7
MLTLTSSAAHSYPSIDFHHKSQRLAVGTHEGSTIIYDLKTATRLYVLEGHTRPVTALSWSPDGHRLVSVSLEESKAVVWKVGLGILSMFMPGAPPRQGSGAATQAFKTFEFHVGDEGSSRLF